jgi:hypothetical protein
VKTRTLILLAFLLALLIPAAYALQVLLAKS